MKTSDYIIFRDAGRSPSGKTKITQVHNLTSIELGLVRWHGPWRRYVFYPSVETFFDADCLFTIAEFCERQTKEHYNGAVPSTGRRADAVEGDAG